ncbi:SkfA peptide export ATP-binding protein SkfE [Occultella aeris]|uniref:SkfA peptide export ATP-binding protein SkfE n=1 Tax=Occultella aeris TaxID=2761496 RepID=A0A7M4DPR2_9MICO|nr:ATP-binding cassette domain-containing protein [Occultella aeris]VZO39456.1 SkfA peptide export ATP-binding protein SkfE [Occultella aeris]
MVLEFENVGLRFRGGAGVQGLTFAVAAGEIVALVGLNGAGKTTLMRLALGMLRAQDGTVTVHGSHLADLPAPRWREVGALVDAPLAYPELTVRQNLSVARLLRGTDPRLSTRPSPDGSSPPSWTAASGTCPSATSSGSAWPPHCSTNHDWSCSTSPATRSTRHR